VTGYVGPAAPAPFSQNTGSMHARAYRSQAPPPSHCTKPPDSHSNNTQVHQSIAKISADQHHTPVQYKCAATASCLLHLQEMVSLLNHGFSIYRCQPAITILQQNSDTIMAPAVTNQPAEQNPGTPNGVCGD